MKHPYRPLFRNAHLATIVSSYWPRSIDETKFPVEVKLFRPEPNVQIVIHCQRPAGETLGDVILVHGLEGSSNAPYMLGLAGVLLEAGFATHRMNIRTCGGSEFMCGTFYHAGLTSDIFAYLMDLDRRRRTPAWLVGFSLGGNMALKLAGEMEDDAARILGGVCAISAPVDLKACVSRLDQSSNRLYRWHFLRGMQRRLQLRHQVLDAMVSHNGGRFASIYEFDDKITGPAFGFRGADHYYQTQSAARYTHRIRVPALVLAAEDDPLIPPSVYEPLRANPFIDVELTRHGGHNGFLALGRRRHWADDTVRDWILDRLP